jgi:hypothetical protein
VPRAQAPAQQRPAAQQAPRPLQPPGPVAPPKQPTAPKPATQQPSQANIAQPGLNWIPEQEAGR